MSEVSKLIKQMVKQKIKTSDIINNFISKGYDSTSAKRTVYFYMGMRYLKFFMIFIFSLFILLFIITAFMQRTSETYTHDDLFSKDPEKWVIEKDDSIKNIDVSAITQGDSIIEGNEQIYKIPYTTITTLFSLNGYYKGNAFSTEYKENQKTLMRISKEMNPNDGVIEGFIVEKINDYVIKNISVFIFVDEDWKRQLPNTKIFWGSNYQYYLDYEFNEISDGIYMFEIYDDPNRHQDDFGISFGGIAVGDLDIENIVNDDIQGKTFMRLY